MAAAGEQQEEEGDGDGGRAAQMRPELRFGFGWRRPPEPQELPVPPSASRARIRIDGKQRIVRADFSERSFGCGWEKGGRDDCAFRPQFFVFICLYLCPRSSCFLFVFFLQGRVGFLSRVSFSVCVVRLSFWFLICIYTHTFVFAVGGGVGCL